MNLIQSIVSAGEDNAKVILADERSFTLPKKLIYDNALRKGDKLSDSQVAELQSASEELRIYSIGMRLLARRMHGRNELKLKLMQRGFTKNGIAGAIEQLERNGFLNDEKFAEQYVSELYFHKKEGKLKIANMLAKKGIAREIVDAVLRKTINVEESVEHGKTIAEKKLRNLKARNVAPELIQQKLKAYLLSKGFSFSEISAIIAEITSALSDDNTNHNLEDGE